MQQITSKFLLHTAPRKQEHFCSGVTQSSRVCGLLASFSGRLRCALASFGISKKRARVSYLTPAQKSASKYNQLKVKLSIQLILQVTVTLVT